MSATATEFQDARAAVEREHKLRRTQAERAGDRAAMTEADERRATALANIDAHELRIAEAEEEMRKVMSAARGEMIAPPIAIGDEGAPRPIILDHLGPMSLAALREADKLHARTAETEAEARKAENSIAQAEQNDAEAVALAVREGKKSPKPKAPEIAKKAEQLRAEAVALRNATRTVEADYLAALADEREEILSKANEQARLAHAEAVEVVRTLTLKLAALMEAAHAREFADKVTRGVQPGKVAAAHGEAMNAAAAVEEALSAIEIS